MIEKLYDKNDKLVIVENGEVVGCHPVYSGWSKMFHVKLSFEVYAVLHVYHYFRIVSTY